MQDVVLTKKDITILVELRRFLKKQGVLAQWKKNTIEHNRYSHLNKELGLKGTGILDIGKLLLKRYIYHCKGTSEAFNLNNPDRMVDLTWASTITFAWGSFRILGKEDLLWGIIFDEFSHYYKVKKLF